MIYYSDRSLFIHIPRTSGMSLTLTVCQNQNKLEDESPLIVAGSAIGNVTRHARADALRFILNDFNRIEKFTIVRNPWRVAESTYRYFYEKARQVRAGETWIKNPKIFEKEVDLPFHDFVLRHFAYLENGFYQHWCCKPDGEDLGVHAFKYEQLNDNNVWEEICRIMRLPQSTKRDLKHNQTHVDVETSWNRTAIDFIEERCKDDFERFEYPRHP